MRGGKVKQIIAELLGRRDGVSFGKGTVLSDWGANSRWVNAHVRQGIFRRKRYRRCSSPCRRRFSLSLNNIINL
jgi:hypothetical protein